MKKYTLLLSLLLIVSIHLPGCTKAVPAQNTAKTVSENPRTTQEELKAQEKTQSSKTEDTSNPPKTKVANSDNSSENANIKEKLDKPVNTPIQQPKPAKTIPILYYHAVNNNTEGIEELFVKPAEFEKQMDFLTKNGYTVISFEQIDDAKNIENPVIITFDDGYEDNYINVYPVLKKYGYKATIFICTDFIDKPSILKKSQMKEMLDLISFQSHTMTHPYLTRIPADEAEKEIAESKRILEEITGKKVEGFAYPIGDYNQKILELTKKHYKYAVLNAGGIYREGDSKYEIKRVYVPRNLDIKGFENKIKDIR